MSAAARARETEAVTAITAIAPDGSPYPIGKLEAHRLGAHHLAVSVFVMDGDALLIQQRAWDKYHCGGLWANSVCSHPAWGETPARCAERRLLEELGIGLPVRACGVIDYRAEVTDGLIECERVHVFRAEASAETLAVRPDPNEVSATAWAKLEALHHRLDSAPETLTPWFQIYLRRWSELGL
jgi:isopentenyl-diphosphate delta-isomerase